MATKKEESKAFDVVEPTESKLNIGSKPMVIGHKPTADPTITAASDDSAGADNDDSSVLEDTAAVAASSKKIRIEPIDESANDESLGDESTSEEVSASQSKPSETEEVDTEKSSSLDKADNSKARDFVAEAENQELSAQDAEAEREVLVDELKKSKKYHVNVKEKRDSSWGKVFAVLFAILISILGVYALADAGVIPGGELLPMRFIAQDKGDDEIQGSTVVEESEDQTTVPNEVEGSGNTAPELVYTSELIDDETRRFVLVEPSISFDYPAEFGEVEANTEDYGQIGRITFGFSQETTEGYFTFVLNAKDRIGPTGHDSATLNLQAYEEDEDRVSILYLDPETQNTSPIENASILHDEENYIIFETAGIGYVFAGISVLPNESQFESIVFDYAFANEEKAYTAEDPEVLQLKEILDTLTF